MIRYRLNRLGVIVEINAVRGDEDAPIVVENIGAPQNDSIVDIARDALRRQYGAYGHLLNLEAASPIDLANAMASIDLQEFQPELLRGAEILEKYRRPFPAGTIT